MMMKKMLFFVNPAAGKEEMRFQLMDDCDHSGRGSVICFYRKAEIFNFKPC